MQRNRKVNTKYDNQVSQPGTTCLKSIVFTVDFEHKFED